MNECAKKCRELDVACPVKDCRYHIDYPEDLNCTFITVDSQKNDGMTLREVAKRFGISFVRVKQIEDKAKITLTKRMKL